MPNVENASSERKRWKNRKEGTKLTRDEAQTRGFARFEGSDYFLREARATQTNQHAAKHGSRAEMIFSQQRSHLARGIPAQPARAAIRSFFNPPRNGTAERRTPDPMVSFFLSFFLSFSVSGRRSPEAKHRKTMVFALSVFCSGSWLLTPLFVQRMYTRLSQMAKKGNLSFCEIAEAERVAEREKRSASMNAWASAGLMIYQ